MAPLDLGEPPVCSDGRRARSMLEVYMEDGVLVKDLPGVDDIRDYVLRQLEELGLR